MILVRWCIPDMSPQLRNRIRREAYITNEIIIQHEAQRASGRSCDVLDTDEETFLNQKKNRWNRVLRYSISTHDFDLEVHGSPASERDTQI